MDDPILPELPAGRPVVFLFPGQGTQHPGIGRGLYRSEPGFREALDACCEILAPELGLDLRDLLFPAAESEAEAGALLEQTWLAQPALFALEHSLALLWRSRGVEPEAMIGHSLGEYVAATLAGVFELEAALRLVAVRGRLMQGCAPGAMLAVPLPVEEAGELARDGLALAAVNAPRRSVLSGPEEAVARLERSLAARGIESRRLRTSHAFHSALMEPVLESFACEVERAGPRPPRLRWVSNLTGTWMAPEDAVDPAYWARHLRGTVLFAAGIRTLLAEPDRVFLEVGPGRTLARLVRAWPEGAGRMVLSSLEPLAPAEKGEAAEASSSPLEAGIRDLWSELLGAGPVGPDADFFALGGDSLLAARALARLHAALGRELSLRDLLEHPTPRALAATCEAEEGGGLRAAAPPLLPLPRGGEIPLSFGQERLWLLDQLAPGSAAYNIPVFLRLSGSLDTRALTLALSEILRRHEALRTELSSESGEPRARIRPADSVSLPLTDLESLPEAAAEAELRRLCDAEAGRPFDLRRAPLLRGLLVRCAAGEHALLLTVHHIAFDGWSKELLLRELETHYRVFLGGGAPPLPEPLQYADYAAWQRSWLQGETLDRLLAFWRQRLAGAPVLDLPTDRPRPAVFSFRGRREALSFDPRLTAALRQTCRQEGVTLFMLLAAAVQTLLGRMSRQSDLLLGFPIAGRDRVEIEGTIGFFVNTLVLRTDLASLSDFRGLLASVREAALEAQAHRHLPFEKLVDELHPERDPGRNPLFQVLLILQKGTLPVPALEGLSAFPLEAHSGTAKVDLTFELAPRGEELAGFIEHCTDLFDRSTVQRLGERLRLLLEEVVLDARRPPAEIPWLTEGERRQLVAEWNDSACRYPGSPFVHERFAAIAACAPDAPALLFRDRRLSYRELDDWAGGLAERLRALGVGPDVLVGLCAVRSPEMVAAALAVLQAGGAYLPLDPGYPRERLAFMLRDSGARVLLIQPELIPELPAEGVEIVPLSPEPISATGIAPQPPAALDPDHLAYVLYTSGSTGRPKGVQIPHRALDNLLRSMAERPGLSAADTLLAVTSLSFDISGLELFLPLTVGGTVALADQETVLDSTRLAGEIRRCRANVMQATPATWRMLIDAGWEGEGGLRVLCGGEALSEDLAARLLDRCGALWNVYGPTETTIWSATEKVERGASPSLGRPIANTSLLLLDPWLQPVPVGVPGELCIGGTGLARGYRGRPELTAERFVPDPAGGEPGARLYRTGDLARQHPDGRIEYLGRLDQQVKLRGFRIELGEIEAALGRHPGIEATVVTVRRDHPGESRLVAYLVPRQPAAPSPSELKALLRADLPDYMIPSAFVTLDALPLTPNRKVDRRALPAPERSAGDLPAPYAEPKDPVEELLAALWAEVLALPRVGVDESFFDLGGSSLLGARVLARVRDVLAVELSLRDLIEAPTLRGFLARVEAARSGGAPALPPPVAAPDAPAEASFGQQRLWALEQRLAGAPVYNMPCALWLSGPLDASALEQSLAECLRRHQVLRTAFSPATGRPTLWEVEPAAVLGHLDLTSLPDPEPEALRQAAEEARQPFDLARGPFLRGRLLRCAAERHLLLLSAHHIAFDAWSRALLFQELGALYEAFRAGRPSPLPELPLQYADFARWQREVLPEERMEAQARFWRERLAGAAPLELPTDHPRPAALSIRGGRCPVRLPDEVARGLEGLARREGVTPFLLLSAAFAVLLQRSTDRDDITFGAPFSGRDRVELEGLIGFFVDNLVLRVDLAGDPPFRSLLGRVRETALEAYAQRALPFQRLVEAVEPRPALDRNPVFQSVLSLQSAARPVPALPGVEARWLDLDTGTAKFDLLLELTQEPGRLGGYFEYSRDLFDPVTVERMAGHLLTLLGGIAGDPGEPLSELHFLTAAERHQLLHEWQATRLGPLEGAVHHLFAEVAARSPEAVALRCGSDSVSYGDLDCRAGRLARRLLRLGVGPETLVGVCLDRSVELIVALLAVLKAGGAYVPLDPRYPRERLALLLEETRLPVLLTRSDLVETLPPCSARRILLDAPDGDPAGGGEDAPGPEAPHGDLAYVMFTSGSTGKPKGVCVTHGNIVRLVRDTDYIEFGPGETFLAFAPASFDASTLEIWGPLLNGGLLVIPPAGPLALDELAALLRHERISTLWLTAGLFHQMVDHHLEELAGVKQILAGGDVLSVAHVRRVLAARDTGRLVNGYGPTENTTFTCCHPMSGSSEPGATVPIGRPIARTTVHVLDRSLRPVPPGSIGELWTGGAGVARGYLGHPALTAERFIPDPFGEEPGARLYRTGDLVRFLSDGALEFLGRNDGQVKIRGFRVEPGEIREALLLHPGLQDAVVVDRRSAGGEKVLVAYGVARPGSAPGSEEIRSFLKTRVPDFMIPAAFVLLDELPLNPNGKVDRSQLPPPDLSASPESLLEPRTPVEETVAVLFAQLLDLGKVGVDQDFFSLGGHSLKALVLLSQLREEFGVELTLQRLFETPTVEGIAAEIDALLVAEIEGLDDEMARQLLEA